MPGILLEFTFLRNFKAIPLVFVDYSSYISLRQCQQKRYQCQNYLHHQIMEKSAEKPFIVEISDERAGQRIDNFLLSQLKGVPKSRIYRLLRKGEVRVNKGRIKPDYRLKSGDQVRIPPVRVSAQDASKQLAPTQGVLALVESSIIYDDKNLMVLNKPAGLAVHGGSGIDYGVIEALRTIFPQQQHLELVHRLDRDTSGCLLVAKKRSMLKRLHEQLRNNDIQKKYVALLKGRWADGKQIIDAPLRKNTLKSGERIVRVDPEGKRAQSIFKPVKLFAESTLMEVELITGRTHQIRVHASHAGYPIAGDEKYGHRGFNLSMKALGLNRLFLHAKSLTFFLSEEKGSITVVAPLGPELEQVLEKCENEVNLTEKGSI
jgi:23S rRNA pseudouridine955/2504/2580 synthase